MFTRKLGGKLCVSVEDFAKKVGVSSAAVIDRLENGGLPYMNEHGGKFIPLNQGLKIWKTKEKEAALSAKAGKKKKSDKPNEEEVDPDEALINRGIRGRANKLIVEAKLKDLEFKKRCGELVEVKEVELGLSQVVAIVRQGLENFADRTHSRLASLDDPQEVHNFLDKEVRLLMENLSDACKWKTASRRNISEGTKTKRAANG